MGVPENKRANGARRVGQRRNRGMHFSLVVLLLSAGERAVPAHRLAAVGTGAEGAGAIQRGSERTIAVTAEAERPSARVHPVVAAPSTPPQAHRRGVPHDEEHAPVASPADWARLTLDHCADNRDI
jgi:hypothetical protein